VPEEKVPFSSFINLVKQKCYDFEKIARENFVFCDKKNMQIYSLLTDNEINEFEYVIKLRKKKTLQKLYAGMKKGITDREKLFQLTFDQSYKLEKDYLLRNEIRLLRNEWREFLAVCGVKRSSVQSEWIRARSFLLELERRKAWEIYEQELESALHKFSKSGDLQAMIDLTEMKIRLLVNYKKPDRQVITLIRELISESKLLRRKWKIRGDFFNESVLAWSTRMNQLVNPSGETEYIVAENMEEEAKEDPVASYYHLKIRSFYSSPEDRRSILEEMLGILKVAASGYPPLKREQAIILSNLAVEYSFIPDYEKSISCFESAYKQIHELSAIHSHQVIFNYASTLLRAGKFTDGKNLLDKYYTQLLKEPAIRPRIRLIRVMSFLFTDHIKEATAIFEGEETEGNFENFIYSRLVQCILYFENGKFELAEREATNVMRQCSRKEELVHHFEWCKAFLIFLKKLPDVTISPDQKKQKEKLMKITSTDRFLYNNILHFIWLRKTIERTFAGSL
jgi:hypothetical protein